MKFLKLSLSSYGNYLHKETSNIEMCILQYFLATDIDCFPQYIHSYLEWVQNNSDETTIGGNLTSLYKEHGYVFISNVHAKTKNPTELKISQQAFITLLYDWQKKVFTLKPQEVTITYDDDNFIIETSN